MSNASNFVIHLAYMYSRSFLHRQSLYSYRYNGKGEREREKRAVPKDESLVLREKEKNIKEEVQNMLQHHRNIVPSADITHISGIKNAGYIVSNSTEIFSRQHPPCIRSIANRTLGIFSREYKSVYIPLDIQYSRLYGGTHTQHTTHIYN